MKMKKKKALSTVVAKRSARWYRTVFTLATAGALILAVAMIYGYAKISKSWSESGALKKMQSEDWKARSLGIRAATRHKMMQHVPKMCDLLRADPSKDVRIEAAAALARLDDRNAVPSLFFALGDTSDDVAEAAVRALQRLADKAITWETAIGWWEANGERYAPAYRRPDDSGTPIVDAMAATLKSEDKYVRYGAVVRLAKLRHPAAAPLLADASTDAEAVVSQAAIKALAEIKPSPPQDEQP